MSGIQQLHFTCSDTTRVRYGGPDVMFSYILWRPTLGLEFGYRLSGFVWDTGVYQCHTIRFMNFCRKIKLSKNAMKAKWS